VETDATTWIRNSSNIYRISSNGEAPDILCTPPSSPLETLFPELSGLEQDDALHSGLSNLLQDDVFQSGLCANTEKYTFDTGGSLNEVSQGQSDSDQRPMNISGMHTLKVHAGERPYVCDQDGC
ncbi:hypothetical protein, partial [Sansalvadorimonas verongulae]|uniref:hypothetical protein n=1 Tax=Sansalvadorimonas verongulae TaxID=2172824 RepID=UPI001E3FC60E